MKAFHILLFFAALFSVNSCTRPHHATEGEFASKPDVYSGQKVSLVGTWVLSFEGSYFVPAERSAVNPNIWIEVNWAAVEKNSAGFAKRLRERAVFPKSVKEPDVRITFRGEGLLEKTADARPLGGFGHLGAHSYRLSIERISKIE